MAIPSVFLFFSIGHHFHIAGALTRVMTKCHLGHVMVGDERGVIDPTHAGDKRREFDTVVGVYPTLQTIVEIPVPKQIDPREFPLDPTPISVFGGLDSFFSNGLVPHKNCVSRTLAYLSECELHLPAAITTPRALYEHALTFAICERVFDDFHAANCEAGAIVRPVAERTVPAEHRGIRRRPARTAQTGVRGGTARPRKPNRNRNPRNGDT